jgi:CRP-like cAMP-binding protein
VPKEVGRDAVARWDAKSRAGLLAKTPLFGNLSPTALQDLAAAFLPRSAKRGTFVFLAGEPATNINVLAEGRLKVIREGEDNQDVILRLIRPGEMFGAAGLWGEASYPASAVVQADAVILRLPVDAFRALVASQPELAFGIIHLLATRLREAEERIEQLQTERVERRLAQVLLRLANKSGVKTARGIDIGVPLSREDLAEMAGTTLSTASRTLTAWSHQGIVEVGRQRVSLREPHRLVLIAEDLTVADSTNSN